MAAIKVLYRGEIRLTERSADVLHITFDPDRRWVEICDVNGAPLIGFVHFLPAELSA